MNVDAAEPGDTWHLSASNIGKALAAPQLENWGFEQTAEKVVRQLGLIGELARQSEAGAVQYVKGIRWEAEDGKLSAADRGTAIHEYIEARLLGTDTAMRPAEHAAQLAPFLARVDDWLRRWQPEPVLVEQVVYNPAHHLAGRLDFVLRFPRWEEAGLNGEVQLTDAKTHEHPTTKWGGVPRPFGNPHALQLATYKAATHVATLEPRVIELGRDDRKSRFYLANADELAACDPMPHIDGAVILHVTPGHAHLHPIEAGQDVYHYARAVAEAWRFAHVIADRCVGDHLTLEVPA